jgi:hypothetical protein
MKYRSPLVSQGSGSVAGCTFSHNRFGNYIRNRTVPTNPNSVMQGDIRTAFSNLATDWHMTLDDVARMGWDNFAANMPLIDSLGQTYFLTGFNWYIACNATRSYFGKAANSIAPVMFNMSPLQPITVTGDSASGDATITFNNGDEWATAVGGYLFLFYGRPTNTTINFYKSPFSKLTVINGAVVPPTSPKVQAWPGGLMVGVRYWLRAISCNVDGRISVPQIIPFDVII